MTRSFPAYVLLAFLAGCQTSPETFNKPMSRTFAESTPLEQTWLLGSFWLPASATKSGEVEDVRKWESETGWRQTIDSALADPQKKIPVAVFLHGCGGLSATNWLFIELLMNEGFVVIAPDSFARLNRQPQCYAQSSQTYRYRIDEARYALSRLTGVSWVDENKLILAGHSEGGEAVGMWSYPGYAALISTGADCDETNGKFSASADTPALSLVGSMDPRELTPCSVSGRGSGSNARIVKGADHQVYTYPEAQEEIRKFLKNCCN